MGVQRLAMGFLILADSIDSRDDSRSYVAAGMLQLARSELVMAATSRECDAVKRADAYLGTSEGFLSRGVNTAANSTEGFKQAHDAMRTAIDNALKVLCK
jgi:hypothetical protein